VQAVLDECSFMKPLWDSSAFDYNVVYDIFGEIKWALH